MAKITKAQVADLADELFASVQSSQGYFFVSDDGGGGMSESEFFERIRGRLAWGRKAMMLMDAFLRKYGQADAGLRADRKRARGSGGRA